MFKSHTGLNEFLHLYFEACGTVNCNYTKHIEYTKHDDKGA